MPSFAETNISLQRPSATGSPRWEGPQNRILEQPLTETELSDYQNKGFTIVRNVFTSEEMEQYCREADHILEVSQELCEKHGLDPDKNLRFANQEEGKIWKIDPFISLSPVFNAVVHDRRILDRLASIYDGYEATLFKDKIIYKPPNSRGSVLHQDYNWWQGFPESLLSVAVALDASTQENGCTQLWTGHKEGFRHEPGVFKGKIDPDSLKNEDHTYVELQPGDMAIFSCFTPHAAEPNTSDRTRRILFLSYNDSRDGEHYAAHYEHFRWYRTQNMTDVERADYYYL